MDNQNNMPVTPPEGYNNFNGYPVPPQAAPQAPPPPYPPQQYPAQPAYYVMPQPEEKKSHVLGILSLILGIFGCCYGVTSIIGIILAIIDLKRNKANALAIIGLIISILTLIYGIATIVNLILHPEIWDQSQRLAQQWLGQ